MWTGIVMQQHNTFQQYWQQYVDGHCHATTQHISAVWATVCGQALSCNNTTYFSSVSTVCGRALSCNNTTHFSSVGNSMWSGIVMQQHNTLQ
jgi:hypothetical protein